MGSFNLSALAVRQSAVTLYFLLFAAVAGAWAFVDLGRAEDPVFTVKVMLVQVQWPGATAQEMQDQVADKLERRIMEVDWLDPGGDHQPPGHGDTEDHVRGEHAIRPDPGPVLPIRAGVLRL